MSMSKHDPQLIYQTIFLSLILPLLVLRKEVGYFGGSRISDGFPIFTRNDSSSSSSNSGLNLSVSVASEGQYLNPKKGLSQIPQHLLLTNKPIQLTTVC